jgi:HSP20 family protein
MRNSDWLGLRSEIDRLFEDFSGARRSGNRDDNQSGLWSPAVDVSENADQFIVRVDLPGVKEKDLDVEIENNLLTIKGERNFERAEEKEDYRLIERSYGGFFRSFSLPSNVDPNGIHAALHDGLLTVNIPKAAEAKARKVALGKAPKQIEAKGKPVVAKTMAAGSAK